MITKRTEGKIKTDFGIKDYYKYYKTNSKKPVDLKKYHKVINEFNKGIVNLIMNDDLEYKPIKLAMVLCVRKVLKVPRIENGKLINYSPIDWKTTNQLRADSEEAANKKLVVRYTNNHTSKFVFRIKLLKHGSKYSNKQYYRFKACRSFQRLLAKRILDPNKENFNAYKLY